MSPRSRRALGRIALACAPLFVVEAIASRLLGNPQWVLRGLGEGEMAWRATWFGRHSDGGAVAMLGYDAYDPERGWTLRAGVRSLPLAGGGTVSSNSRGVRGSREYSLAKPPSVTRIVAIGDWFTFGDEVDDEDPYPAQLQRLLPSAEVLNLGVHGYGHDQMLLRLRRDGLPYRPDIVILGWVDMDAARNVLGFRDYMKPRFELHGEKLELTSPPIPPPDELLREHRWEPAALVLASLLWAHFATADSSDVEVPVTNALLREIVQTIRSAHAVPVFVHLPQVSGPETSEHWMKSFCGAASIECVFPLADLEAARAAGTELTRGAHYSPDAHRIVAERIRRQLEEHNLLGDAHPRAGAEADAVPGR